MTIAFTPRKESLSSIVYARQKADGKIYCYFSTPKFCLTFEELLDHAQANHTLAKEMKARSRSAGRFQSALLKHASDLRIHSMAIIRRSNEIQAPYCKANQLLWAAIQKQAERTNKLKT
jgi:hypothetical protein